MAATSRKRWTIAGVFLGVGLIAWLASMGAGRLASSFLALPDDVDLTRYELGADSEAVAGRGGAKEGGTDSQRPGRKGGRKSKKAYVDPIVARNIFDSEAIGAQVEEETEFTGDGGNKSDLKVVLLATVVSDPENYSSALIAEKKGEGAFGYGLGDDILGEGTIVRIEQRRVIIRRSNGNVEYIAMNGGDFEKKSKGSTKAKDEEPGDDEIQKAGENKYIVDQALVDQIMENPEKLYSQVRVVPHKGTDGEIDGYRMSGIRRKSFFSRLGIKNGDIVHAVNGKPLTSMSAGMDAYNSLQSSKDFTFDITRRNNKQTFEYEIR